MKLQTIKIENYKSIESVQFKIFDLNGSYTYSLLGVNESGKSSFLKALSLINDLEKVAYPSDFHDDSQPISIELRYVLEQSDFTELFSLLSDKHKFDKDLLDEIDIKYVDLKVGFLPEPNPEIVFSESVAFVKETFMNYTMKENLLTKKNAEEKEDLEDLNLITFFEKKLETHFWSDAHSIVFWKATPEYLLLDEIDLISFAKSPRKISIPLMNCFILSGIKYNSIKTEIEKLNSPVNINSLQSRLGELTTRYIRDVWPEHPISIAFQINNNTISLLVEDDEIKFKPKTANQRSDGFKQFISFLLTVSVENHNERLSNTIILIDEPETHLHPPAQVNLLQELIKITSNKSNNILFFATHSNYLLIDKENLDRSFRVTKVKNSKTQLKQIEKKNSTYAEVNYDVFNILSTDYHNELYGYIEAEDRYLLDNLPKNKKWTDSRNQKVKDVSVSEYIRHSIHHPENILNKKYSEKELLESIKNLRALKDSIL